jgi:hypothetical protein
MPSKRTTSQEQRRMITSGAPVGAGGPAPAHRYYASSNAWLAGEVQLFRPPRLAVARWHRPATVGGGRAAATGRACS